MNADREQQIAARAYQLWEAEGRPHGAHERHWEQASLEIAASDRKNPGGGAKTAKRSAKAAAGSKPAAAKPKSAAKPKGDAKVAGSGTRTGRAKPASSEKATHH